ncbi:hypothetical protein EDB84DRAFT_1511281 [Lactarius hengduanensis]|nr:hypothetical protein EDB84DRAFT_1511281 [Lactarius hengduanensis]
MRMSYFFWLWNEPLPFASVVVIALPLMSSSLPPDCGRGSGDCGRGSGDCCHPRVPLQPRPAIVVAHILIVVESRCTAHLASAEYPSGGVVVVRVRVGFVCGDVGYVNRGHAGPRHHHSGSHCLWPASSSK